jgi:hypothetical protein
LLPPLGSERRTKKPALKVLAGMLDRRFSDQQNQQARVSTLKSRGSQIQQKSAQYLLVVKHLLNEVNHLPSPTDS